MELEKNDVDISKLFKWGKAFVIEGKDGKEEGVVYIRLLGDADANRTRVYAVRKSAELRKKLWDENNVERWAYIRPREELDHQDLINLTVFFSMREINERALREVSIPRPKQPKSNASLDKMEKYQKEIDEYADKLGEAQKKFIKKEVDALKASIANDSDDLLYRKYLKATIQEFCEMEALKAYREMELYCSCYKDDEFKERLWDTFEDYDNEDSATKEMFRRALDSIDIGSGELKKLREATL